jgi:hypothetical protein
LSQKPSDNDNSVWKQDKNVAQAPAGAIRIHPIRAGTLRSQDVLALAQNS